LLCWSHGVVGTPRKISQHSNTPVFQHSVERKNPWPVSSTGSHPALSGSAGPLELLRVQEFKMVRASGNAPEPGTNLVRLRL
jgi:hypothetical protein